MKADKNYSMSKPTKTYLNMLMNDEKRSEHKELFVEAEFHYTNAKKKMSTKMIVETEDE
jgi:hypothetical protein